ncbi:hypothetical protein U9M48_041813 [Paspalum notatum var. saurae]|uniref:Uncharacterized protein n=1 Tax=Paspalum notatum var. saurae TaxID=547442 RepID=A0AAQ3XDT3_PASNO
MPPPSARAPPRQPPPVAIPELLWMPPPSARAATRQVPGAQPQPAALGQEQAGCCATISNQWANWLSSVNFLEVMASGN